MSAISDIKYTIIHVDNRASFQISHNKKILQDLYYVDDIDFCNGNEENAEEIVLNMGIDPFSWSPYEKNDTRSTYLPGEIGVWASNINVFNYIVSNKIEKMLVLEDDCLLNEDFEQRLDSAIAELPESWDFLSLYWLDGQNAITSESDIGLLNIHKSINQPASNVIMLYSLSGAKKILKLLKEKGIEYTVDCFIYRQAKLGLLNGYSIKPTKGRPATHTYDVTGSLIDPTNVRKVDMK